MEPFHLLNIITQARALSTDGCRGDFELSVQHNVAHREALQCASTMNWSPQSYLGLSLIYRKD